MQIISLKMNNNHIWQLFHKGFLHGWNGVAVWLKLFDNSISPNIPALDQLNLIEKTSFRPVQLDPLILNARRQLKGDLIGKKVAITIDPWQFKS